jgi:hypothetical protein
MVKGRVLALPASPGAIRPRPADRAEHVAAHDRGADVRPTLLDHRRAGVRLATLLAAHFVERTTRAALARRRRVGRPRFGLVRRRSRRRHRDAQSELGHFTPLMSGNPAPRDPRNDSSSSAAGSVSPRSGPARRPVYVGVNGSRTSAIAARRSPDGGVVRRRAVARTALSLVDNFRRTPRTTA